MHLAGCLSKIVVQAVLGSNWNAVAAGAVTSKDAVFDDGHAPEVVPADASPKKTILDGQAKDIQLKQNAKAGDASAKAGDASADAVAVKQNSSAGNRGKAKRLTASPVFLSPATSLNSNSSGLSRHSSGGRADFDSLANAATAVATHPKPAGKPVLLSSAALQKMDSNHNNNKGDKSGKKAASVKSVKSAKSGNHSRTSSIEWQDVELQSEGEDKAVRHPRGVHGGSKGGPSHMAHAAAKSSANAAFGGAETETDDGISETEGGQLGLRAGPPEVPSSGNKGTGTYLITCTLTPAA